MMKLNKSEISVILKNKEDQSISKHWTVNIMDGVKEKGNKELISLSHKQNLIT